MYYSLTKSRLFMRSLILWPFLALLCFSCKGSEEEKAQNSGDNLHFQANHANNLDSAYFASGCFWCVESIYQHVKGVKEAVSGYAGGSKKDPTYQEVTGGQTDHAETVKVYYDPSEIDFKTLVKVYYGSQDPTTVGQDPDFGEQYRSIIFYQNDEERQIAQSYKDSLDASGKYDEPIVTEIKELKAFYRAEAYHQDYERKNPNKGYIQQVSKPRLERFKEKHPGLVK